MNTVRKFKKTSFNKNISYVGETIEQKIARIVNNNEPITDGAPIIYTERRDGVQPAYDIRTDRFEVAIGAMDKVAKSHLAKREENQKPNKDEKPGDNQQSNIGGNDDSRTSSNVDSGKKGAETTKGTGKKEGGA